MLSLRLNKKTSRKTVHWLKSLHQLSLHSFCFFVPINQIWIFRILSDMRTLSADWMANTNKSESELQSSQHGGEDSKANIFYPRAVAPTTAQVCIIFNSRCSTFIVCYINMHEELHVLGIKILILNSAICIDVFVQLAYGLTMLWEGKINEDAQVCLYFETTIHLWYACGKTHS